MADQYEYSNGRFVPKTVVNLNDCPMGLDWDQYLLSLGWKKLTHFPTHQNAEFAYISAYLYRHQEAATYLAEITLADEDILYVGCPNGLDLLLLQRDFLNPLCRSDDADLFLNAVIDAAHCLLDENRGLPCAQRVKDHDRRMDDYYRELRERKKTG